MKVFLTLQSEPVRGRVYAFGVMVLARRDVQESVLGVGIEPKVFVAATPDEVEDVREQALLYLHGILERIDAHNQALRDDFFRQLGVQTYVYDGYELSLLVDVLLQALDDPRIDRVALALFSHFHDPSLLHADQHRKVEVPFPVVVLTNVLRQLVALPASFTYQLPETRRALQADSARAYDYQPSGLFQASLSNVMKSDAIFAAWHDGAADRVGWIESEIARRLRATADVLEGLRRRLDDVLFAWPPKFRLPAPHGIQDPTLSKLAFMAHYECAVRATGTQERRARPRHERVLNGDALPLRPDRRGRLVVDGPTTRVIEPDDFTTWLLSRDDRDGDREAMSFADARWRNRMYGPALQHAALVKVRDATFDPVTGATRTLTVEPIANGLTDAAIRQGERFLLQERFTEWNADRAVKHLQAIDAGGGAALVGWLTDRDRAAALRELPRAVMTGLVAEGRQLDLLPSKAAALVELARRAVTLLWGPPGTGKTHFLAEALLALGAAHRRARVPFRVLVTAQSHAAIENLLRKLAELRARRGERPSDLGLAKVGDWRLGDAPAGVEVVARDEASHAAARSSVVVGATVWAVARMERRFDVVVVDEASQLRVPDATIALDAVAPGGRAVLAGDHLQLPPIVAADYPDPEPGKPLLHRSVFEAVQALDDVDRPVLTAKLTENFRMNDVLTGFAAEHLYGRDYVCATERVRDARLPWTPPARSRRKADGADELVRFALDPAFPIVLVMLDGVFAARENLVEAGIVADLVVGLREGLRDASGKRYADTEAGDRAFFRDGVFITCPHHAQIHAVRHALAKRREWRSAPFVDTVDKMQGQEAQAVLVSYGVSDPDFALQEAEFIYSRNRLNVAITRAKTKCVVCLPRGLVEGVPQVVESEGAARGLAFMRALRLEAERRGEGMVVDLEGGAQANVWRVA